MRVGIDISSLVFDRGVSRYTSNLIRGLHTETQLELFAYGSSLRQYSNLQRAAHELGFSQSQAHIDRFPPTILSKLWQFRLRPISKRLPKIDLFHSWDWFQPPDTSFPLVSTIHDLAMLKYPKTAHPDILEHHQRSWEILKKRKAHIIAVSHSTKQDIMELLGIPSSRIHVVYEALPSEVEASEKALSDERYHELKHSLNLDKPFILAVGTTEPRKNLKRLIKAWKPLSKKIDLIIAGAAGWEQLEQTAIPELRLLGRVPQDILNVLYGEAKLLAYPSLYEGFGLPILEAFYHGTPVVTSNISAMPEVAGNAAELVDPLSVTSIRNGIETILDENEQAEQRRLQKMVIRLHMFSWKEVALETEKVYRKAMA